MNKDSIKELLHEAQLKTRDDFTQRTVDRLELRLQKRMRLRLYFLMAGTVLFFAVLIIVLIAKGFIITLFGLLVHVPKLPVFVGFSMIGAFLSLFLYRTSDSLRQI